MKGAGLLIILDPGQWIASFYSLRDKKKGLCKNTLLGILKNTPNSNGFLGERKIKDERSPKLKILQKQILTKHSPTSLIREKNK
jgi:hypothetical protein